MEPTIGRIVHYIDNEGNTLPAIVVKVHNRTCVDLQVFKQSTDGSYLATSVCEDPTDSRACTWRWPLRA